ncbi:hypothetical protein BJ165DRAFT_1502712 [Panaeolus papilionaceus]|nr:hypothetical protein BJ165DRAFT_1502712 [Panaeolus papilionaceus]
MVSLINYLLCLPYSLTLSLLPDVTAIQALGITQVCIRFNITVNLTDVVTCVQALYDQPEPPSHRFILPLLIIRYISPLIISFSLFRTSTNTPLQILSLPLGTVVFCHFLSFV